MPTRDNLTLRSLKGSALSFNELDSNFTMLADTIDTLTVSTVFNDLVITGNLTMNGVLTSANSARMEIGDPVIVLNKNSVTPANDVGLVFQRYTVANTTNYNLGLIWDESTDALLIGKTSELGDDADVTISETWMAVANGNVGIGTTDPQRKLTVRSDSGGTITALALYNANTTDNNGVVISFRGDTSGTGANTFQEFGAISSVYDVHDNTTRSSRLEFWTSSNGTLTNRMMISGNGNIGIAGSPDTFSGNFRALQINKAAIYANGYNNINIGTNVAGGVDGSGSGGIYGANDFASRYQLVQGTHRWYNAPSGTAGNPITFSQVMMLDTSGNLGIGTASPGAKLDVSGDIRLATNATYLRSITSGGTSVRMLGINSGDVAYVGPIDSGPNSTIFNASSTSTVSAFYTSGAERLRIDNSGNVGIGTTTPTFTSGSGLEIQRSDADATLRLDRIGTSANAMEIRSAASLGEVSVVSNNPLLFSTNNTERMRIDNAGVVGVGTTIPASYATKLAVVGGNLGVSEDGPTLVTIRSSAGVCSIGAFNATGAALTFRTAPSGSGEVERIRIDSAGNIGLGITPNAWSGAGSVLQSNSFALVTPPGGGNDTSTFVTNAFYNGTNWIYRATSSLATRYDHWAGQHRWFNAPTGGAGTTVTFTQAMTLDASGRLAIGTTTASARLDVAGDIEINSNFTLNSEAITLATTTKTQVASFAAASFRSGKLIVQAYDSVTGEVQVSELLVAHNGTTASSTEYGVVFTGTNPLVVYDVDISAGNVRLMATRTSTNSTQYKVSETLMVA